MDGYRWRCLEEDIEFLSRRLRLTVVIMPYHPAFVSAIAGSPAGQAEARFREAVTRLCGRLGVPCLNYDAAALRDDPDYAFHDLMHLNRRGAIAFSEALAVDLARLSPAEGDRLADRLVSRAR